ncbi:MAG: PLDc N-terminal domain-containing protein [Phycisphaerales bacterium]
MLLALPLLFILLWCGAISIGIAQMVLFIFAVIDIAKAEVTTNHKILWIIIAWIAPLIGPVLWWQIGKKDRAAQLHPLDMSGAPPTSPATSIRKSPP